MPLTPLTGFCRHGSGSPSKDRFLSQSWLLHLDQVMLHRGSGLGISSWKTIRCYGSVVSAEARSPSSSTVRPRLSSLRWNGPFGRKQRQRPWFRCSACNRRCRTLHEIGGTSLVCRLCSGYDYRSRHRNRNLPTVNKVRRVAGLPHRALARETVIAQAEIARLLRATVRDLQRRAKRGGKR